MNRGMISLQRNHETQRDCGNVADYWAEPGHPSTLLKATAAYRGLLADMENSLKSINGFDALFLSPTPARRANTAVLLSVKLSGRQVKRYNICLIPRSEKKTMKLSKIIQNIFNKSKRLKNLINRLLKTKRWYECS